MKTGRESVRNSLDCLHSTESENSSSGMAFSDVSKDQPAESACYSVVSLPKRVTLCHFDGLPSGKTKTELSLPGSTPPVVAMEI